MDCRRYRELLEDLLDGELSGERWSAAEAHARDCPACRRLEALARSESRAAAEEPPPELAAAILERTSGPACPDARRLLAERVETPLRDAAERELLAAHLDGCRECAALDRVLAALSRELPKLADLDPGEAFPGEVLERTAALTRPFEGLGARLALAWRRLVRRPRLAWEGAYLGAVVLTLASGLPGSPLAGIASRALEMASTNPVAALREPVWALESRIAAPTREIWHSATERTSGVSREIASEVARRSEGTLRSVREEAGTFWDRLTSDQETSPEPDLEGDGTREQGDRT